MSDPLYPLLDIMLNPTPLAVDNYKQLLVASPRSDALYCNYAYIGCHQLWGPVYWFAGKFGNGSLRETSLQNNLQLFRKQLSDKLESIKGALKEYPELLNKRKGFDASIIQRFHVVDQMLLQTYRVITYALQNTSQEELKQRFSSLTEVLKSGLAEDPSPLQPDDIKILFEVKTKLWDYSGVRLLNFYLAHPAPKPDLEKLIAHLIDPKADSAVDEKAIEQFVIDIKTASAKHQGSFIVRSLHKALLTLIETMDFAKGKSPMVLLANLEWELRRRGCNVFDQEDSEFRHEVEELIAKKSITYEKVELKLGHKLKEGCYEVEDHPDIQIVFSACNCAAVGMKDISVRQFSKKWGLEGLRLHYLDPEGKFAIYERPCALAKDALNCLEEDSKQGFQSSFALEMKKVIFADEIPFENLREVAFVDDKGNVKWDFSSNKTKKIEMEDVLEIEEFYIECTQYGDDQLYIDWMKKTGLGSLVLTSQCRAKIFELVSAYQEDGKAGAKYASPQQLPKRIKEVAFNFYSKIHKQSVKITGKYDVPEKQVKDDIIAAIKKALEDNQAITRLPKGLFSKMKTELPMMQGYKRKTSTMTPDIKLMVQKLKTNPEELDRIEFYYEHGFFNQNDIKLLKPQLQNETQRKKMGPKKLFPTES